MSVVSRTFVRMRKTWSGEVVRTGAAALVRDGVPAACTVGEVTASSLRDVARGSVLAEVSTRSAVLLQDGEVADGLEEIGRVEGTLMRARLRLACEVAERGLHLGSGFGLVDWISLRCPDLDARPVRDLAKLAVAGKEAVHAPIIEAILRGAMSLSRGAAVLRALQRIRPGLSPELYAAAVAALVGVAVEPGVDDRAIGRAINDLLRRCLPEKKHDDDNKARRGLRDVHESNLADGSVKRLIITFGDDVDYEAVRAVLQSPLAAPATKEEAQATGEQDDRTPGARRYDAFMTVFRRGVAGTEGEPTTPKAMVAVTLDFEVLCRLMSESGDAPGCGVTLDGSLVTADTIRRLACEADIVPIVLGSKGRSWTRDARSGSSPPGNGSTWPSGTGDARSRGARCPPPGATPTTCCGGAAAGSPTSSTTPCSVPGTMPGCTTTT